MRALVYTQIALHGAIEDTANEKPNYKNIPEAVLRSLSELRLSTGRVKILDQLLHDLSPFEIEEDAEQYAVLYTSGINRIKDEILELDRLRNSVDRDGSMLKELQQGLRPFSKARFEAESHKCM